jgi:membrane peptidoglycan carboxypeptidase
LYTFKKENSWRDHQAAFLVRQKQRRLRRKSARLAAGIAVTVALVLGTLWLVSQDRSPVRQTQLQAAVPPAPSPPAPKPQLPIARVRELVSQIGLLNADQSHFFIDGPDQSYTLRTQLDQRLQKQLINTLDYLKQLNRGKPQRIAMVAMDGKTGMIRAMAGFDLGDPKANPCTAPSFPAASIIKIVTASAAIDRLGYTASTPLFFNGQKYTLYKRQLKDTRNKYTSRITLAQAFAESINPVFGKIGKNKLGGDILDSYAQAFGFNQTPETDLPMGTGSFAVTDNDFHNAELGCGFNRQTRISPIFGATMVTAVLNQGMGLVPRVVDRIEMADGTRIYTGKPAVFTTPVRPKTAETMMTLMHKTISRGTAKKAFQGYSRDKVLSKLTLGGKTGSLYSTDRTVKYDWFVGFGKDKSTGKALAVSVMVGHRKYIGTRAGTHARKMLKTYFAPRHDSG